MFIPDCMEDGSYKPIQCYEKHGIGKWCWCVDDNGLEIIGSKVENSDNAGNLTAEKCDNLRRNNTASEEYWTAYYRHSTASPLGTAAAAMTTPKPILEINQSGKLYTFINWLCPTLICIKYLEEYFVIRVISLFQ